MKWKKMVVMVSMLVFGFVGVASSCPLYDMLKEEQQQVKEEKYSPEEKKVISIVKNGYLPGKYVTINEGIKKYVSDPEWKVYHNESSVEVTGEMYLSDFPNRVCKVSFFFVVDGNSVELWSVGIEVVGATIPHRYAPDHPEIVEMIDIMFKSKGEGV